MSEFTILVSRPCAALRSNGGHGNRYVINAARKSANTEAWAATHAALNAVDFNDRPATVNISYTEVLGPKQRAMDDDNLIGAMKPYRDGIALALGINDKRMVTQPCGATERGEMGGVKVRVWWEVTK